MTESVISAVIAGWTICSIISATYGVRETIDQWRLSKIKTDFSPTAQIFSSIFVMVFLAMLGPVTLGLILHELNYNQRLVRTGNHP